MSNTGIYNTKNELDRKRLSDRFEKLKDSGKVVRLNVVLNKKTIQQIRYLHVLYQYFALHTGFTEEEVKCFTKKECHWIYAYERNGRKFYRSNADLTVGEMSDVITWFIQYADLQDIKLPDAKWSAENLASLKAEYSRHELYLTRSMTA